jgi:catechol 2,3-dioxygenase-like lactoylglutathione lyase family enzyme
MQIEELTLQTRHLAEQKAFYCRTLGLPQRSSTADSFTVRAGTTRLHFQEVATVVPYHLAFAIPRTTFQEIKAWVRQRVSLLAVTGSHQSYAPTSPLKAWNKVSEEEVFFPVIPARSFYCCDADNSILKWIAYDDDLSDEMAGTDGASAVLRVSEVGLPVADVRATASQLKEQLGIEPYPVSRPASPDFGYLGDVSGQLVVVRIGHPWMPTQTTRAEIAPVQLTISGQKEQQIQLSPYPYTITTHASPDGKSNQRGNMERDH